MNDVWSHDEADLMSAGHMTMMWQMMIWFWGANSAWSKGERKYVGQNAHLLTAQCVRIISLHHELAYRGSWQCFQGYHCFQVRKVTFAPGAGNTMPNFSRSDCAKLLFVSPDAQTKVFEQYTIFPDDWLSRQLNANALNFVITALATLVSQLPHRVKKSDRLSSMSSPCTSITFGTTRSLPSFNVMVVVSAVSTSPICWGAICQII